jgi:hypothetical protein
MLETHHPQWQKSGKRNMPGTHVLLQLPLSYQAMRDQLSISHQQAELSLRAETSSTSSSPAYQSFLCTTSSLGIPVNTSPSQQSTHPPLQQHDWRDWQLEKSPKCKYLNAGDQ